MKSQMNFTQAVTKTPWYAPTPASQELLEKLDKDLEKWSADAHVSPNGEFVCSVVEARFGDKLYRFLFRVHDTVDVVPITDAEVPMLQREQWKLHQRVRNVLKNFMPSVFDRLAADQQFQLVMICPGTSPSTSHCVWAASKDGLGISVVTTISPATGALQATGTLPEEVQQWMQAPATGEPASMH